MAVLVFFAGVVFLIFLVVVDVDLGIDRFTKFPFIDLAIFDLSRAALFGCIMFCLAALSILEIIADALSALTDLRSISIWRRILSFWRNLFIDVRSDFLAYFVIGIGIIFNLKFKIIIQLLII